MARSFLANLITGYCLTFGMAAFADGPIASADTGWPQWRGPTRDGISTETGLLQSWPEGGPTELWKVEGIGIGWSCPIVQSDRVFITGDVDGDLVISAYDTSGTFLWKTTNGKAWAGSYPGARACGVLASGLLYHANAHGRVTAFDAKAGKEQWSVNIMERFEGEVMRWAISENLLIDGDRLLVTPSGSKALFAALDRKNGETIWMTPPIADEKVGYSSPILFEHGGQRLIANFTNPHAWLVDAESGELQWHVPLKTRWGAAVATPTYADGAVFIMAPDGPGTSKLKLTGNPSGSTFELAWHAEIDALTGSSLYRDGRLYTNGCKASHTLQAIDAATGKTLYEMPRLNPRKARHATGAMIWADQRLYVVFGDGHVALLNPTGTSFEVAGVFKPVDTRKTDMWAHPVLLDGKLYLRYHNTLWCYDVAAK